MNAAKVTLTTTVLAAAFGLALGLLAAPAQADCPHGNKGFIHPHCGGGGGGDSAPLSLEITYDFGALTGGECISPDCATTIITVDGTLKCGNNFCDFVGDVPVVDESFGLPEGLRTLLDEVAWRGEPLDPTACYDYVAHGAGVGTLTATRVFLRSFPDAAEDWSAKVSGTAFDELGFVDRSYEFIFRGGCDSGVCPDLQNLGTDPVEFDPGSLRQINAPVPKKKEEKALAEGEAFGTACRCTMSSTPDCPDDVVDASEPPNPIPSPPIRVTVTDVTAP